MKATAGDQPSLRSRLRALRHWARRAPDRVRARLRDRRLNDRWAGPGKRFLVVRHAEFPAYDVILQWLEQHAPSVRRLFELRVLPCRVGEWSRYVLHIPWLQDPVESWSRRSYAQACRVAAACERRGIPVVNRVDRLSNAMKLETASRLSRVGIRTPAMRLIRDHRELREGHGGPRLPLFVREDAGHGGPMVRVDTEEELRAVPLEGFRRPIAVEFIDVRSPEDGLYRKFRYVVAGRLGVPHHMQTTQGWITRGNVRFHSPATRAQEESYVGRPDPHHEMFQRARVALGLDLVAFDYGFDRRGEPIIWEANPFPYFHIPKNRLSYLAPAMHRTLAAVIHLYLERAGLDIPAELQEILFTSEAVSCSADENPRSARVSPTVR